SGSTVKTLMCVTTPARAMISGMLSRSSGLPLARHLVDFAGALEHLQEIGEAPRSGFGLLRLLQPVEDRVAVGAIQPLEEAPRLRVALERPLQILGHRGGARRIVGAFPAAVGLRALDLRHPGRSHPARRDERARFLAVDARPKTRFRARAEFLQPERIALRTLLPVDPSVAERHVERFGI